MRLHWRHLRRAMGEVLRHPGMSISVWKEHGRILEEMIRGDGDAAAELMRRHLVDPMSASENGRSRQHAGMM
jgi:DNA-binding GntR family transcriptional regulator